MIWAQTQIAWQLNKKLRRRIVGRQILGQNGQDKKPCAFFC